MSNHEAEDRSRRADMGTMTLIASIDVALRCWSTRCRRLTGADPSFAEPRQIALERSLRLVPEIEDLCARMRLFALLASRAADARVADIHSFEMLLTTRRCVEQLRTLHQSLMSLFPEVKAESIEAVRIAISEMTSPRHNWFETGETDILIGVEKAVNVLSGELTLMGQPNRG